MYVYWKIASYTGSEQYGVYLAKTVNSVLDIWLIAAAINAKNGWAKKHFWDNRFLNFTGKISYGIYIYHPYMFRMNPYVKWFIDASIAHNTFLHTVLFSVYFLYALNFAVLIFICRLSYTLIEKPLLNLKRFFNYRQEAV